jgi:uncharacterized membrane protein YebE (DUF533 family)
LLAGNVELQTPLSLHVGRTMMRATQAGENIMTKSTLFIAAIAASTALATPALAQWQWQSQEPAAYAAMYPNGDRNSASPATRDTMALAPSAKSPHPTVMRATKGK